MANTSDNIIHADPLGAPLSTPPGTAHLATVRPAQPPEPPLPGAGMASMDAVDGGAGRGHRAGLLTRIAASTAVLLLLGVGAYAWFS